MPTRTPKQRFWDAIIISRARISGSIMLATVTVAEVEGNTDLIEWPVDGDRTAWNEAVYAAHWGNEHTWKMLPLWSQHGVAARRG